MLATKNYVDFQILEPITRIPLAEWSGAQKANRALPEDMVRLSAEGKVEVIAAAPKRPLVGVLHLTSKYMYGMTSHQVPMYLCEPLNKGFPSFRVACKERDRSQNLLVSFQYESWDQGAELPRGSLLKILGPVEDFAAEAEALAILSSPWSAPRPESLPASFLGGDRPVLSAGTLNIDPPGCKDIDDVLTFQRFEDGSIRMWITIADVTESVVPTSKEYKAAWKIGATTYQGGTAVRPMLHKDLSEKALSLLPGEQRYGLALRIDWHPEKGFLKKPMFEKVIVINQMSFTYENIGMTEPWILETMETIATELAGRPVKDSHEWIEQFMLFYNREAALILREAGVGLLRIHDEPLQEKRKALQEIDTRLEYLAFQAAKYAPVTTKTTHWGLSLESYCHASSPIRRFADIVNQQIVKDWLDKKIQSYPAGYFEELADWLNERQKQIAAAERDYAVLVAIEACLENLVEATFLWKEGENSVFYIPSWKTLIRFVELDEKKKNAGETVKIHYYCDRRRAKWKERMLYKIMDE